MFGLPLVSLLDLLINQATVKSRIRIVDAIAIKIVISILLVVS